MELFCLNRKIDTMTMNNDLSSFGALLKSFRMRRRLTQQTLAQAIGVHRNAIGRWEQGDFLPESKTMVLELARHLHLNDRETRQLLEASLTALSPYWMVPSARNPYFTGRDEVLEALHAQLHIDRVIALTQSSALHGLGGIGKTQIALEYAYRHALEYSGVFWISAEAEEQIIASFLRIAEVLGLPERENKDQQRVVVAVQRWLSTHGQWLVIWDNVEDLSLLDLFLPAARSGAILITTRCQILGTLAQGLDLAPMEQEEGMLFLLRRAKVLPSEASSEHVQQFAERLSEPYAAASALVRALGGLPLALDQAGAYLEATQCGLPAYLDLFRTRRTALLQQRGERAHEHPASVSTTFNLAITATARRHPAVWDLLRICALLQPDAIPEELFRQGGKHFGATLEAVCCDELEWNLVVSSLCSYSLLSRQPEEQTLSLHRLVQAVLLDTMTEAEQGAWHRRVIEALDTAFPAIGPATEQVIWKRCERLLPHTLLCLQQAIGTDESLAFASLAYKGAQYLSEHGRYAETEPLYQRALHIQEHALAFNHSDVAQSLNGLANLYKRQGKYAQAEPLYQRALHIWEQQLGPEHLDVARLLYNLGELYREQGKYAEAKAFSQRALHIWERQLGPEHTLVAYPLNCLANLHWGQGQYAEAEVFYLRALHIWERQLGPGHTLVAYPLNNLASLYYQQGKYAEAEAFYQRALHVWEQALGPGHPETAHPLNNLGELYYQQGKYAEAEAFYQRALHVWEQAQEPEHCDMANPLNNLGKLYYQQGKYAEAEVFFQHALSIREQQLDQYHPDTAQTLHDLAIFRQAQGNLSEALSFAERALSICAQSLEDTHSQTAATRTLYAQLLQEQASAQEEVASELIKD